MDSAEKFFECKFECKMKNKRYIMYIDGMECWEFEDRCNAVTEIKCDDNVYIIVQKGVNYFFGSSVSRCKLRFKDNTFNLVKWMLVFSPTFTSIHKFQTLLKFS